MHLARNCAFPPNLKLDVVSSWKGNKEFSIYFPETSTDFIKESIYNCIDQRFDCPIHGKTNQ